MGLFSKKEKKTITITVKGMTCGHCEMHVKQALEKVKGVKKASPDRKKESAVITITGDVQTETLIETLIAAVKDTGYEAGRQT